MTKNNYKRLGDFIQKVDVRNTENEDLPLMGLTIDKKFIPSVANTIGTDLSVYKIIAKNQFACSLMQVSRDGKIPIARYEEDRAIMSPAYPMFEVIDTDLLLPEYLMMWFSRSEFDRQAAYYAVGGVRGSLDWNDFIDLELPVPTIAKQYEIVQEYQAVEKRIALNEQLIAKLEETAQAVYREWFVEFEFPDENGKPYKSNGGKMVWNEELEKEVPEGWEVKKIGDKIETLGGGTPSTGTEEYWENGEILWYSPTDITTGKRLFTSNSQRKITKRGLQKSSAKLFPAYSLMMTSRATIGVIAINTVEATTNQGFINLIPTKELCVYFLFDWIKTQLEEIKNLASGSTFLEISKTDFRNLDIIVPKLKVLIEYENTVTPVFNRIQLVSLENQKLEELKDLLLIRMMK